MQSRAHDDPDGWLAHAAALRALAAALTCDPADADDLVQETWLRGLRSGADGGRPRAWWSAVLRNLARDRSRERARRTWTERVAARAERLPSEDEVLARLELAQRLAAEVARLEEPYRTALHLRHFEGLAPREIAARSGESLETVRARLRRGLERLRERMDRAHGGDRRAWSVGLTALSASSKLAPAAGGILFLGAVGMAAKIIWGVALVVVVGFGSWLALGNRTDRVVERVAEPVASAAVLDAASGVPRRDAVAQPEAPGEDARVREVPRANAQRAAEQELRGTVVVVDERGVEHRTLSGTLVLAFSSAGTPDRRTVAFEQGQWSTRIPASELVGFERVETGGRDAVLEDVGALPAGPDPLEVRARFFPRGRLRVLDAATKRELDDVEIRWWRAGSEGDHWIHPGDTGGFEVLRSAGSPIELPDRARPTAYFVRARGRAWARVDFDHASGGERTVELADPASLAVTVAGEPAPEGARVRLYPLAPPRGTAGSGSVAGTAAGAAQSDETSGPELQPAEFAAASVRVDPAGAARIDDLAPGHYAVRIETGEEHRSRILGAAEARLEAHALAEVAIVLGAREEATTVHLFGTLALPAGADVKWTQLSLRPESGDAEPVVLRARELAPADDIPGALAWDAGEVPVGIWGAHVHPVGFRQVVHAEEPGRLRVDLRVPDLVAVAVEVRDAATGEPLKPDHVRWTDAGVVELTLGSLYPAQRRPGKGKYGFTAPAGPIEIRCDLAGYQDAAVKVDLRTGPATVVLELRRISGVRLQVFEGGARLRAGFDFFDGVRIVRPGERMPNGTHLRTTEYESTRALDPGRYEVRFPSFEGYEPLEAVIVEVEAGEVVDATARARRKG